MDKIILALFFLFTPPADTERAEQVREPSVVPHTVARMYMTGKLVGAKMFRPVPASPRALDLLEMPDGTFHIVVLNKEWFPVRVYLFDPADGLTRLIWEETKI